MRLTLAVYDPYTGTTLRSGSWHLPEDLAAELARPVVGERRVWGPMIAGLPLNLEEDGAAHLGLDPLRLECRVTVEHCECLSCRIPAAVNFRDKPGMADLFRQLPRDGRRP